GLILTIGSTGGFVDSLARQISATASVTMLNRGLRDAFVARAGEWAKLPGVEAKVTSSPAGYASVSPSLFTTTAEHFIREPKLHEEAFGPAALVVQCKDAGEAARAVRTVGGSLTGTIHAG